MPGPGGAGDNDELGSSRSWKTAFVAVSTVLWFVAVMSNVTFSPSGTWSIGARSWRHRLGHADVDRAEVGRQVAVAMLSVGVGSSRFGASILDVLTFVPGVSTTA